VAAGVPWCDGKEGAVVGTPDCEWAPGRKGPEGAVPGSVAGEEAGVGG
jgi:hypothetical protein